MIAKPFYLLKKIIFTTNLKQSNLIFRKNPFYNLRNHSCNKLKTIQVKTPFFDSYPYSNNLISFKMTFIGLIFV